MVSSEGPLNHTGSAATLCGARAAGRSVWLYVTCHAAFLITAYAQSQNDVSQTVMFLMVIVAGCALGALVVCGGAIQRGGHRSAAVVLVLLILLFPGIVLVTVGPWWPGIQYRSGLLSRILSLTLAPSWLAATILVLRLHHLLRASRSRRLS